MTRTTGIAPAAFRGPLAQDRGASELSNPRRRFSLEASPSLAGNNPALGAFETWWRDIPHLEGSLDAWRKNPGNRADRGGQTNWGITQRAFMGCAGAANLPKTQSAFENMTQADAKKIARALWKTSGAHRIDHPAVALVVGDWFWGSNTRAWVGIKEALNRLGVAVPAGTRLDEATVQAINSQPPARLIAAFSDARRGQHARIAAADASQRVFLGGWQARVDAREAAALRLLASGVSDRDVSHSDESDGHFTADRVSGPPLRAVPPGLSTHAYWIHGASTRPASGSSSRSERTTAVERGQASGQRDGERPWPGPVDVIAG